MATPPRLTAADVVTALRRHYGAERDGLGPEWAALEEFSLSPGGGSRRIDLFCVRAWRSGPKGHERHAIEIKVSRADLRTELAKPHKAAAFEAVAHRFYLATPAGLVHDDDPIPDHWGRYEISTRGGCRKVKEARRRVPDDVTEQAFVEAFRRAARAETRIRTADATDPAALVPDLTRRVEAAERATHRAQAASRRDKDRLAAFLRAVGLAGGWQCICGAPMDPNQYSRHADGSPCPAGRYGYAELDYVGLATRLGLPAVVDETPTEDSQGRVAS